MVRVRKVALMGYPAVGKSSLAHQFVEGVFSQEYSTTIEDHLTKNITIGGRDFELNIFDTMGVTELPNFPDEYLVMDGWVVVFSVAARRSFDVVPEIYSKLRDANPQALPLVILGNKSDLAEERMVSEEEAKKLAVECGALYIESSAKENKGVSDAFKAIILEMEKQNGEPIKDKQDCTIL